MLECQCKQEDHLCDVCCKDGEDAECKPVKDIPAMKNLYKNKTLPQQFPGAPCDDYNGYCDVFLKCRAVDADGPLSRLKDKFFSKEAILGYFAWIKQHWWAVVLMGVGLILLMAGTVARARVCVCVCGFSRDFGCLCACYQIWPGLNAKEMHALL